MNKIIRINEDQFNRLKEENKLTEFKFYNTVRTLLKNMMVKPISFDYPTILKLNGIDKDKLVKTLIDYDIIRKQETLVDTDSEGNNIKPKLSISYSVPKLNFEIKLRKLYTTFFDDNDNIIECDCGGATGADSAGAFVGPLNVKPILRRKLKN